MSDSDRERRGWPDNAFWFLVLLMAMDVAFVLLHALAQLNDWNAPAWSIEQDGGYAEQFQYLKELLCCVFLLGSLRFAAVRGVALAWLLLLVIILLDDILGLHEKAGAVLSQRTIGGYTLSASQGELLFMAGVGALVLPGVLLASWHSGSRGRTASIAILLVVSVFAFFAAIVDFVHAQVRHPVLHPVLGLIEDGGEMFSITLLCWLLFLLCAGRSIPPGNLFRRMPVRQWHLPGVWGAGPSE